MPSDLTEFIVKQLEAKGFQIFGVEGTQTDLKTYCFRGHDHKTPSLHIRRLDGMFYCFGCGVKGANWNALRAYIDVDILSEQNLPDPSSILSAKLSRRHKNAVANVQLPWGIEPWTKPWRGLSLKTLKGIGAVRWFDDISRCERILFPVTMYKEIKGWVARRSQVSERKLPTPYRNAKEMKAKKVLFPFDYVAKRQPRTVVLVEGPFDALRLVNCGIPALAILGTGNYDPGNRVHLMNAGAERIILAMDGDQAGDEARIDIAISLKEMEFEVKHFHCPPGKDPGNMAHEHVERLIALINK